MHIAPLIHDIAVILLTAGVVTLIFQKIKQPLVLGYLVAGIVVGPHTPPFAWVTDTEGIQVWSELGVVFLMFALGLEFNFKKLRSTGFASTITGVFEALFMLAVGFATGRLLGFNTMSSVFLGAVLAISSTTVIIKTLNELGLKNESFAETVFGILIIEDLVAILLLATLSTFASGEGFSLMVLFTSAAKLLGIVAVWIVVGLLLIPRFVTRASEAASDETLVVLSIGLCLGLVLVAGSFGYSTALGAFVMGALIAESSASQRVEHLLSPLRDIFGAVFFVSIGMLLNPKDVWDHLGAIVIVSVITIVGKILSTYLGARFSGQEHDVALRAGLALAQIGEFSFIIAGLGLSTGRMDPTISAMAVSVAVVTTFTTPYLIRWGCRKDRRDFDLSQARAR